MRTQIQLLVMIHLRREGNKDGMKKGRNEGKEEKSRNGSSERKEGYAEVGTKVGREDGVRKGKIKHNPTILKGREERKTIKSQRYICPD